MTPSSSGRPPGLGHALVFLSLVAALTGCNAFVSAQTRGTKCLKQRNYDCAIRAYTEAIAKNEYPVVAYANRCYAYEAKGDHQAAVNDCAEALSLLDAGAAVEGADPKVERAQILNNRAVSHIGLRRFEDAVKDLDAAIELVPGYAEAFANRGRAEGELEDCDAALVDLDEALRLDPDLAEAYGNRAYCFTSMGDPERALEEYGRAIKKGAGYNAVLDRASLLYTLGCFPEALVDYKVVAKQTENDYLAWMAQQQVKFLDNYEDKGGTKPKVCEAAKREVTFPSPVPSAEASGTPPEAPAATSETAAATPAATATLAPTPLATTG